MPTTPGILIRHLTDYFTLTSDGSSETLIPRTCAIAPPIFFARSATRTYYFWALAGLLLPAVGVAVATRSWEGLWLGGLVRIFLVNHFVSSINSLCHSFRSRPYGTNIFQRPAPSTV